MENFYLLDEIENEIPLEINADENSSETNADVDTTSSPDIFVKRQRKKRHQVKENCWKDRENKRKREQGIEYKGVKNIDGKWVRDIDRKGRALRPRCKCSGRVNGQLKCTMITDEDRQAIFDKFWGMTWCEKKIYIQMLVIRHRQKRPRQRTDKEVSRRCASHVYYLQKEGEKFRVCKTMFLNTFDIGEWAVRKWKLDEKDSMETTERVGSFEISSLHKCNTPTKRKRNANQEVNHANVQLFLGMLPKMESHYYRATSSKQYLEPIWDSKSKLYNYYCKWCKDCNHDFVSSTNFAQIFQDENLSLYRPKKDECDNCASFKAGNLSAEQYNLHISRKAEARNEKESDKGNLRHVYTMDLQSLLLCPKTNVSSSYFKTKLAIHNFTIYSLTDKEGYCYLWNETEGNLTSNEFSTILSNFIAGLLTLSENTIVFFSDGCTYQNRNATLSNALLNVAVFHKIYIEQKYLEKGHTQMECDSMHSCIERKMKFQNVNIPADYIQICKDARKIPRPFQVSYLSHDYFKNFGELQFYKSIRPGIRAGDSVVTDIRALKYSPDGKIFYKLNFHDEYKELPVRNIKPVTSRPIAELPPLYLERLKIKKAKFQHLQDLKSSMPSDYHEFYNSIPHETTTNT